MKKVRFILHKFLLYFVFVLYLVILFAILFRTSHSSRTIRLVPFATIIDFLLRGKGSLSFTMSNLLGNIILFVPLGIYLDLFHHGKRGNRSVFLVFLTSLLVEIIQFTFKIGVGDIDDIILNTLGGYIGSRIHRNLLLKFKDEKKITSIIEIVALIGAIISLPILYFYRNLI